MAVKKEIVKQEKIKNPTRQKIIVEQGRVLGFPKIDYKILHTEVVDNKDIAEQRVKELKNEYKDIDGLSVHYFSL